MTSLRIRRLTKQLGNRLAVRGIDLDVADGELLVIVGPSGCGKTTILRMVAGLETPTSGEILVDGAPVVDIHRGRGPIAMMFQEAALYPHLTARGNIGFPLRVAGVHAAEIRDDVTAIATRLGILPLLDRRPGQLSGGQRQRVAMARSLVRRPDLLLMDEPMSNLDAKLRGELRATIGHLHHELGITMLYVTHDQVEAMSLGDRIAVMRDGVIAQIGPPDEVYRDPVDVFVASFIGTPSMNLFVGRLRRGATGPAIGIGSLSLELEPHRWDGLDDHIDRDVVVGVRPGDFRFVDEGAVVDVEHIETVGDRRIVEATLNAACARVTSTGVVLEPAPSAITIDIAVGDPAGEQTWRASHVRVEPDRVHLFHPVTGRSLRARAERKVEPRPQSMLATT